MNRLQFALLVTLVGAAGVWCAWRGLRPRRRSIADVRAALVGRSTVGNPARTDGITTTGGSTTGTLTATGSLASSAHAAGPVRWLADRVARTFGDDLHLIDLTAVDVASRLVIGFIVGSMAVVLSVGAAMSLGLLPFSVWWLAVAPAVGAAAAWTMWADATTKIDRRRRAITRTVNDFIQLVAVGLTTDQSVDEAIGFALSIGDSDVFTLLRDELATAPLRGVPLWEALDQFGTRYGQREMHELAGSIERQGTQGVSITDTVNTLATAMRERALDDLERDADRANANLAGPTVCFVVATVVFLAFPLAIRIGEAFGG